MIDLHYAPTPNGWKISIMLEELGLPYTVIPVNIRAATSSSRNFLSSAPTTGFPRSSITRRPTAASRSPYLRPAPS